MKNLIIRNLNGKIIIPLFLSAGILYAIMLTVTIPEVMSFSGGMKILDMMPAGYSVEYVNSLLETLGEVGRNAYLYHQIPLDMVYPLLFGISFCLILAFVVKKLGKLDGNLFFICLLPLFAALFDYCENIGFIAMLNLYPNNSNLLTQITNIFSVLKSSSTTISFVVLIILLVVLGIRKLNKKKE